MLALLLLAVAVSQCAGKDVVGTLVSDPNMSTLVHLVTSAGLGHALTTGDFTIFAPNNDAFAKLPQSTLDSLSQPENQAQLQKILKYHVVAGKVLSTQLSDDQVVNTLDADPLRINIYSTNNVVTAEGKRIIETDRVADNGVIHVVSDVLMPPSGDIVSIVAGDSRFSTLLTAVQAAGLADALKSDPLTVFAPTNDAFAKLNQDELNLILAHPDVLKEVLTFHVVDHTLYSVGLYNREVLHSIDTNHDPLRIRVRSTGVTINDNSHVTEADLSATNGVVHVIDNVLIPPSVTLWLLTGIIG